MFAHNAGFCLLLLPGCSMSVLGLSGVSSQFLSLKFFPISSVWQVREGCVLPRCRSVVHWVWECIGEKCSGIQVPVPYVFRNCGINQVSNIEDTQKSSGWEGGLEIRTSGFQKGFPTTVWNPLFSSRTRSLTTLFWLPRLELFSWMLRSFVPRFLMSPNNM